MAAPSVCTGANWVPPVRRLDGDAVVLLVADQHAGLTGAEQVGDDGQRHALAADLEGAVALALQVQHVAEAVAHQQVEQPRAAAGHDGQAGGLVADRDAERVAEGAVAVAGVDPHLAGVLHQHGQVQAAVAVEVAGHDRAGPVVDARTRRWWTWSGPRLAGRRSRHGVLHATVKVCA